MRKQNPIFDDEKGIEYMQSWLERSKFPNYASRVRLFQKWIAFLAHLATIVLCVIVIWFSELKVSHIGAAVVFTSTLVTGTFLVLCNNWKSKVEALNYGFGAVHPEKLLRRYTVSDHENSINRLGKEWFQYKFKFAYEDFISGLISVEVFIVSIGTLLWGFGDVFWPEKLNWIC